VTFPRARDEITDAWLTSALRGAGVLDAGRVVGHDIGPVTEQGQTTDVVRIALRYDMPEAGAPASVVLKLATPFESARQYMHSLGLYEREVRFYQEFGADPGISIPRGYFAEVDLASGHFAILMEDMRDCRNGDFWVSSLADAEEALRHLAPFHAKWWQSPVLRERRWLRQPDDVAYYGAVLGPVLRAVLPQLEAKFPSEFRGYTRDCARRLAERWDAFWPPRAGQEFTLVHTDYHPKQLFFATPQGGRFAVFDWQSVCVGVGGGDVQRILLTGLSPADLRKHQERLIDLYHAGLREHGIEYAPERLREDVREQMLITLYIMVFALATTDTSILQVQASERGCDWRRRVFDDLGEVLEDNRAIDVLG
jgi:hypothetical protein